MSSSDKNIRFYWIKFLNYVKLFEIQVTDCYKINVTFISFQKDGLLKFAKSEFWHVSSFSCIWKKGGKVFGKNTVKFPARRNRRGWGGERGGDCSPPPRFLLKLTFYQLIIIVEKSKKIQTSSNSSKTTGNITLVYIM